MGNIRPKIGKRYRTRDGRISGPVYKNTGDMRLHYPFCTDIPGERKGADAYKDDGTWSMNPRKQHVLDLVEPVQDEPTHQPKHKLIADEFLRITGRAIDVRDVALIINISENLPGGTVMMHASTRQRAAM